MRTEAQIETSRRNGALSHGPITEEGRQRSRLNAVKHGLSARMVVLCRESYALFEQLQQDYLETFQPCSIPELHIVQRMVAADWRLHRAQVVATAINDKSLFDHRAQDDRENANCDHDYRLGIDHPRIESELAFVERSEARCERAHARALAEFVVLRKLRPSDAQPIQLDRHDVTTTGRNPAQYLGPVKTPEPLPPESKPDENGSNERGWPRISATPGNENTPLQRDSGFNKLRVFSEEPKPPTPAEAEQPDSELVEQKVEPEPCIIIPYYPKCEEEPLDDDLTLPPGPRLVS